MYLLIKSFPLRPLRFELSVLAHTHIGWRSCRWIGESFIAFAGTLKRVERPRRQANGKRKINAIEVTRLKYHLAKTLRFCWHFCDFTASQWTYALFLMCLMASQRDVSRKLPRFICIFKRTIQSRGKRRENVSSCPLMKLNILLFELQPLHHAVLLLLPLRHTLSLNPNWIICGPAPSMLH